MALGEKAFHVTTFFFVPAKFHECQNIILIGGMYACDLTDQAGTYK